MRIPTFAIVVMALSAGAVGGLLWERLHVEGKDADQPQLAAPPPKPAQSSEAIPSTGSAEAPQPTLPPPTPTPTPAPVAPRPALAVPTAAQAREPVNAARVRETMASSDRDGDGMITRSEAEAANRALFQMWDLYDFNKDGNVNAAEVERTTILLVGSRGQARRVGPDTIITSNDKNGDGVVTRDEAKQTNGSLNRTWPMYDLNNDGKTDRDEVARYLEE